MHTRKALAAALLAAATFAGAPIGALARSSHVEVYVAPPAPIMEEVPAPRTGYVWAPGYWNWNGHKHVWRRGHWEHERHGYAYVPPRWEQHGDRWRFDDGRWERHSG